jgi:hypothetical protein
MMSGEASNNGTGIGLYEDDKKVRRVVVISPGRAQTMIRRMLEFVILSTTDLDPPWRLETALVELGSEVMHAGTVCSR